FIDSCEIFNNDSIGINYTMQYGHHKIRNSKIYGNGIGIYQETGCNNEYGDNYIEYNSIYNNTIAGIFYNKPFNTTEKNDSEIVVFNDFYNNAEDIIINIALQFRINDNNFPGLGTTYDYLTADTFSINFESNYWGVQAIEEMNQKGDNANISFFRDFYDDFELGKIIYSKWHTSPVENAGANW
ncbi:unnamed protein product, partial [marine sediment metagenome]